MSADAIPGPAPGRATSSTLGLTLDATHNVGLPAMLVYIAGFAFS